MIFPSHNASAFTASTGGVETSRTTSVTVGAGTNRVAIITFGKGTAAEEGMSLTFNGETLTALVDAEFTSGRQRQYRYVISDAVPADTVISAVGTTTTGRVLTLGVTVLNDASANVHVLSPTSGTGTSAAISAANRPNAWIVGSCIQGTTNVSLTLDTSGTPPAVFRWAGQGDNGSTAFFRHAGATRPVVSSGSGLAAATITWTLGSSSNWGCVALAVYHVNASIADHETYESVPLVHPPAGVGATRTVEQVLRDAATSLKRILVVGDSRHAQNSNMSQALPWAWASAFGGESAPTMLSAITSSAHRRWLSRNGAIGSPSSAAFAANTQNPAAPADYPDSYPICRITGSSHRLHWYYDPYNFMSHDGRSRVPRGTYAPHPNAGGTLRVYLKARSGSGTQFTVRAIDRDDRAHEAIFLNDNTVVRKSTTFTVAELDDAGGDLLHVDFVLDPGDVPTTDFTVVFQLLGIGSEAGIDVVGAKYLPNGATGITCDFWAFGGANLGHFTDGSYGQLCWDIIAQCWQPDIVQISLGVNDANGNTNGPNPFVYRDRLREFVELVQTNMPGVPIVIEVQPFFTTTGTDAAAKMAAYNYHASIARSIADEYDGVSVLNMRRVTERVGLTAITHDFGIDSVTFETAPNFAFDTLYASGTIVKNPSYLPEWWRLRASSSGGTFASPHYPGSSATAEPWTTFCPFYSDTVHYSHEGAKTFALWATQARFSTMAFAQPTPEEVAEAVWAHADRSLTG